MVDDFLKRKCPNCHKEFVVTGYVKDWAYRHPPKHDANKFFCSWKCLQQYRRERGIE